MRTRMRIVESFTAFGAAVVSIAQKVFPRRSRWRRLRPEAKAQLKKTEVASKKEAKVEEEAELGETNVEEVELEETKAEEVKVEEAKEVEEKKLEKKVEKKLEKKFVRKIQKGNKDEHYRRVKMRYFLSLKRAGLPMAEKLLPSSNPRQKAENFRCGE